MTYEILLGDPGYSSWSMRPWLVLDRFDIEYKIRWISLYTKDFVEQIGHPPARTVPVLRLPDLTPVRDSLAMIETLAERHPERPVWPAAPGPRAEARSLAAEMHAGFAAIRSSCPMNLRVRHGQFDVPQGVSDDLRRLEHIWSHALDSFGGPWLCGDWSAADAMFAPMAARIAGYGLDVSPAARDYVAAHLADPGFRRWRAMGLARGPDLHPAYYPAPDHPEPWPGPAPWSAAPSDKPPLNETCPYSGKPPTHSMELDGKIWGFCNAFCRDKTMIDPEVWPAFIHMRATRISNAH